MNKRTKRFIFVLAGAVLVILVAFFGFAAYLFYSFPWFDDKYPHQSDELMISLFHEHREEFEQLRAMAVADDLILSVSEDRTVPENLPADRVTEYRRLFHLTGMPGGVRKYPDKRYVEFIASA